MKLAYADPPYPGQAIRHYRKDPSGIKAEEVDSAELIIQLVKDYDGFALSTSEPGIEIIKDSLPKGYFKQNGIRIAAWVKPFCSWKPTHRVQYTWEPVIYLTPYAKGGKQTPSIRDYVETPTGKDDCIYCYMKECCEQIPTQAIKANITTRRGTHGAKPDAFCDWVLDLLGYDSTKDTIEDLYPGSGTLMLAVERKKGRSP